MDPAFPREKDHFIPLWRVSNSSPFLLLWGQAPSLVVLKSTNELVCRIMETWEDINRPGTVGKFQCEWMGLEQTRPFCFSLWQGHNP